MKKVKMLWMPVLLGTVLMATLVGVAGARPNARPEASPALVDYMFSAHHCVANDYTDNFDHESGYVRCISGTCWYYCPIKPPHQGLIRVQRLAMYAYDNGAGNVTIWLRHQYPKSAISVDRLNPAGESTTDNAAVPQVYAYNPANFKVSVLQDVYIYVSMSSNGQKLHGFKLKYEPL